MKLINPGLLIASALIPVAVATPVSGDIEARQGNLGSALIKFFSILLNHEFTGSRPLCDTDYQEGETYVIGLGEDQNGNYFEVCWQNDTDTVVWDQATANAANCLTNLHYTQADTCIDVSGSSCDNGYISGGGRLQNLRQVNTLSSGTSSSAQISASESVSFQAAWNSLIGLNVRGSGAKGPYVYQTTDASGTALAGSHELQVNFIGEYDC